MKMKKHPAAALVLLILFVSLLFAGCESGGGSTVLDNYPYEPDTPVPDAHSGIFVSDHGNMTFDGDGESILLNFDAELAELAGFPEGEQKGTYCFLSGNLPPHGSFPVRYDIAHEMQINLEDLSVVIDMGLASEDGSSGSVGAGIVTSERIPMLFRNESGFFSIIFEKDGE